MIGPPRNSPLFPYTPLFRSLMGERSAMITVPELAADALGTFLASYMHRRYGASETRLVELVPSIARIAMECIGNRDRKSTRLNSSHSQISYAVFCLKKKRTY